MSGWKVDDNSASFGSGVALTGINSIGAGESVIFIEVSGGQSAAGQIAAFKNLWFGGSVPAGIQIGTYTGSGIGLGAGAGGDAVNIYNSSGVLQANISFGSSPSAAPFATFDNGLGANRAFYAGNDAEVVGKYTLVNGNDGVAKYIDFTAVPTSTPGSLVRQGRIGYVGPDYVLPGVLYTQANDYNLQTADVQNAAGNYRAPTATSVRAAYGTVLPPESSSSGAYVPNSACAAGDVSATCRNQPQDWVQAASKTSALANPAGSLSYPIVGTSNVLLYSCYATESSRSTLAGFLSYYLKSSTINDSSLGLLAASGFQPLPQAWRTAINETFVAVGDPNATQLTFTRKGARSWCPSSVVGG